MNYVFHSFSEDSELKITSSENANKIMLTQKCFFSLSDVAYLYDTSGLKTQCYRTLTSQGTMAGLCTTMCDS